MKITSIALKNLTRKKIRTALTIGGVAIAVGVLVSLLGFDKGYQKSLTTNVDKMGYQLLVTAKGCPYEAATMMLKGGSGLRYMDEKVYQKIKNDERVQMISPQLVSTVYDPDRLEGQGGFAMYMGITEDYIKLKPWSKFVEGSWFTAPDAKEVIMGYEAAEVEQRSVGDEIYIPAIDKILKVVGIFQRSGTQDDGIIFLPLKTAQNIFDLDQKLTGLGIKLIDIQKISQFEDDLYKEPGIQVISMAQVKGTILNLVSSAKVLANAVAAIAIFIAAIGVINTILMSVFERTKEIGIIKAIGASRMDVFKLIWTETVLVCAIGGIIGNLLALTASGTVEMLVKKLLPYAPKGSLVIIQPSLLLTAFTGAVLLGVISGIYPAWRAAAMRPVKAIRTAE
jgi:putative ABC transport system permease protein